MTSGWQKVRLSDVADDVTVGHVGPMATRYTPFGIPFLRSQNVKRLRLDLSDVKFIPQDFHEQLAKSQLSPGDVVIVRTGEPGACALIPDSLPVANCSDLVIIRPGNNLDARWLTYYINEVARDHIASHLVGAVQQHFNVGAARTLTLDLPSMPEQRSIAGVLGALDNKIELNRRTSRTLERLGRAIFQAWFVDFEPVKAKAAGARSFPSMPQEAFDALPTHLVESELGPVPEGWRLGCIGDLVTLRGGGTPSTKVDEYWEGGTNCWLTPKDLSGLKDPILLSTDRKITDKGLEKISSGLLPIGTILLSSRAPVGYLVISGVPTAINQGFIAMVCDGPLPPLYVYHWTQSVMDEIKSRASGTTFAEISKTAFRPIKVCVPPKLILKSFTAAVESLFGKLATLIKESKSLEILRDYLLPKLLSAEVRVQADLLPKIITNKSGATSNEGADNAQ